MIRPIGYGILVLLSVVTLWSWLSPWDRKVAEKLAITKLNQYAENRHLKRSFLSKPAYVSGNDIDGYMFYYDVFSSGGAEKIGYVLITVSKHASDVTSNISLDCRDGLDLQTRAMGLGYLCK